MMKRAGTLLGAVMVAAAWPVAALAEQRAITVGAAFDWEHAQSKLVLPAQAAGLKRWRLDDSGREELDVAAGYKSPDDSHFVTVYIYRPQIADAGLWFDRAKSVIRSIPAYRAEAVGSEAIGRMALTPTGAEVGLRMVRPIDHEGNKSTGLAVLPVGGWIVKVRMTGKIDTAAMEQRLGTFVQALRWPAVDAAAPLPTLIEPCEGKLNFDKAKLTKPDMTQALMGGVMQMAASIKSAEAPTAPAAPLCREEDAGINYGVYRRIGTTDAYLLALTDAGRIVSVTPTEDVKGNKNMFRAALLDLGTSETFPNFKGFPSPKLLMETLPKAPVISSVKVGSTTINISSSN